MEKKKRRISKVKKLEEELTMEQNKSNQYLNKLKYLQADFENYRKRVDREILELTQRGNEKLILNLLNIIDELELAIQYGRTAEDKDALIKGVEMVLNKFYKILEHEGLAKIETVGKQFDPKKHEAVLKVLNKDYTEETVIEEIRKGFMLRNKVIRPSMVKIAMKKEVN